MSLVVYCMCSTSDYLKRVMRCLKTISADVFGDSFSVRHTALVSAKTGFGIEDLVTVLLDDWRKQGRIW